ncbi:lipopolysaccharide biosynthesis protein [Thiomicrospira sp.]|uniref:lipopolysaccharide biosynthesis protein n=1 Tax=Thiomicrospira sp. TaxID=935 RepID=UPI002F944C81
MKGPIALGTIRTSFALGLRLLIQAGTLLLVARMLGPDEFGAFAGIASLAVLLGALSAFGMNLVLLGEVSREPSRRNEILPYAIPTTLLCGSVLLGFYLVVAYWVLPMSVVPWAAVLAIGVAELLLQPLFILPANEHLALGRTARSQLLLNFPLGLRFLSAVVIVLVQFDQPLLVYGYAYLFVSISSLFLAGATMQAPWPSIKMWRLPKPAELKHSAGYAALAVSAAGPSELDKVIAVKLLPANESGLYAAASRVVGAVTLPIFALMLSALPRLFREGRENSKQTGRLIKWIFAATLGYTILLAGVIWLVSPVFTFLFGDKYAGIEGLVKLLCIAIPGLGLRVVSGSILMTMNRPWIRFALEVLGVVLLLTLALFAVPSLGSGGMILALAVSEWVMAFAGLFMISLQLRRRRS